jgi:hypothetical protein
MSSFLYKGFCAAFMWLQFGFVIFWQKNFGAKAARKMLVKLTPELPKVSAIYFVCVLNQDGFCKQVKIFLSPWFSLRL